MTALEVIGEKNPLNTANKCLFPMVKNQTLRHGRKLTTRIPWSVIATALLYKIMIWKEVVNSLFWKSLIISQKKRTNRKTVIKIKNQNRKRSSTSLWVCEGRCMGTKNKAKPKLTKEKSRTTLSISSPRGKKKKKVTLETVNQDIRWHWGFRNWQKT